MSRDDLGQEVAARACYRLNEAKVAAGDRTFIYLHVNDANGFEVWGAPLGWRRGSTVQLPHPTQPFPADQLNAVRFVRSRID